MPDGSDSPMSATMSHLPHSPSPRSSAMLSSSKLFKRNPSLRPLLLLLLVAVIFLVLRPHPLSTTIPHVDRPFYTPPPPPRPSTHDVCLLVGHDRANSTVWRFNSRSICITSPVCLPSSIKPSQTTLHTSDFSRTSCRLVTPAFNNLPYNPQIPPHFAADTPSCAALHRKFAACPFRSPGHYQGPACLAQHSLTLDKLANLEEDALVLPGITIVVPQYPYTGNIYHFSNVATLITDVATHLTTILAHYGTHKLRPPDARTRHPLTVLFHSMPNRNEWQSSLLSALIRTRLARSAPAARVDVLYAPKLEVSRICLHNPILLGRRGHVNVWPFPNASVVPSDASSVPAASVRFRQDVYSAFDIEPAPLRHSLDAPAGGDGNVVYLSLPPRVLGYSRRPGRAAVVGGNVHAAGTVRRFSEKDEMWIEQVLHDEARRMGFELRLFTVMANMSLEEQVRMFSELGVVVGIHGANLVNSIFMRPLSAMVEIFPAKTESPCYYAGSNSGLAYFGHKAIEQASPQESGCLASEKRCWLLPRQRLVKIGSEADREAIRNKLRAAMQHVARLHEAHAKGVAVRYDEGDGVYRVVS